MKRIAFSLLSVVMLFVMALPVASIPVLPAGSVPVLAQSISWPSATQWTHPSNCYYDPQDQPPGESYLDLVGNDTIGPAAYYYFGTDYAFFRERVEGDPSGPPSKFAQDAWVVLFDLPERGNYEYLLSLNGQNETVELWENTEQKYLIWNPILKDSPENIVWTNSTAAYANITDDGKGHYFVDWAIPLDVLDSYNITANTTMYFCTSADVKNFANKDYLNCYVPDLAITEKSEAWVSLANKTYNVSYTVCNNGAAPAGATNTTITIDGVPVLEDPVPALAAGVCYNSTVGPFTMSGTNDTIMVCADNDGVVAESNETNNCMENIIACELPVANFTAEPTSGCAPLNVTFTDLSTPIGEILSWSWDFGDGSNSTLQNPSHQYSAGTYNVTLNVTNACGSDTETKTNYITVKAPPVAAFSATPITGYAPLTVTFTDLSTGDPTSWTWDFGDGNNSTDQNPSHQYSAVGTYTVNLTVSNACGINTTSAPVIVTTRPGGGGGGGGGTCYLDIDMLGKITRVRISCVTSRTLESKVAPDPDSIHFLEIDLGTRVLCDDLGRRPEVLVMRLANESPPVPDGSALVGSVYNFTGNYSSSSYGYRNALQCCSGVTFDQNITIVLNYDPNELPEFTASLAVAYYDTEQGIWVSLSPDIGRVAEIGKSTGLINHFSTVAIIAELAPPPAPASFVASALNIEQSPLAWKNMFVGVTGEDITITANVANNGGQEGTYTAELKLNGKTVDTKEVTLAAGQSQQVSFTVSGMDYGQYEVEVAGLSGEFTVSRSINWWLIIGIILAVGLITWAAIWWRKRRKKAAQSE